MPSSPRRHYHHLHSHVTTTTFAPTHHSHLTTIATIRASSSSSSHHPLYAITTSPTPSPSSPSLPSPPSSPRHTTSQPPSPADATSPRPPPPHHHFPIWMAKRSTNQLLSSESVSEEDSDHEQARRGLGLQKNLALLARTVTVCLGLGKRWKYGSAKNMEYSALTARIWDTMQECRKQSGGTGMKVIDEQELKSHLQLHGKDPGSVPPANQVQLHYTIGTDNTRSYVQKSLLTRSNNLTVNLQEKSKVILELKFNPDHSMLAPKCASMNGRSTFIFAPNGKTPVTLEKDD
ncbi:hypothetical protein Tco_0291126 [Tanacetum coccineum]